MRSMVEADILLVQHQEVSPLHHAASRRGPPPWDREEIYLSFPPHKKRGGRKSAASDFFRQERAIIRRRFQRRCWSRFQRRFPSEQQHFRRRSQRLRSKRSWSLQRASLRKRRGPSDQLRRKLQQICSCYKAPIAINRFEAFRPSRALRINDRTRNVNSFSHRRKVSAKRRNAGGGPESYSFPSFAGALAVIASTAVHAATF